MDPMKKQKKNVKTATKPCFILTADCHFQRSAWHKHPELSGDTFRAFDYLLRAAHHYYLPVFIAGDVMDSKSFDSSLVYRLFQILQDRDNYTDSPRPVSYIRGDHDNQDQCLLDAYPQRSSQLKSLDTQLSVPSAELIDFSSPITLSDEICLAASNWLSSEKIRERLKRLPKEVTALLLHQTLSELCGGLFEGELSVDDIPDHVRFLYVGDIHKTVYRYFERKSGVPLYVASPGPLVAQDISELGQKTALIIGEDGLVTSELIVPTRPFLKVDLTLDSELDFFVDNVQQLLKDLEDLNLAKRRSGQLLFAEYFPGEFSTDVASRVLVVVRYHRGLKDADYRVRQAMSRVTYDHTLMIKPLEIRENRTGTAAAIESQKPDETLLSGDAVQIVNQLLADKPALRDLIAGAIRSKDQLDSYLQQERDRVIS